MNGFQLPTKLAAETAASMAVGIMSPIYAQLDPIRMGEIERFVSIAKEYGDRLKSTNVRRDTIEKLLSEYPSHEFVIDREEAGELFERVEVPTDELELVAGAIIQANHPTVDNMGSFVQFINAQRPNVEASDAAEGTTDGQNEGDKRSAGRRKRSANQGSSSRTSSRSRSNGSGPVGSAAR